MTKEVWGLVSNQDSALTAIFTMGFSGTLHDAHTGLREIRRLHQQPLQYLACSLQ